MNNKKEQKIVTTLWRSLEYSSAVTNTAFSVRVECGCFDGVWKFRLHDMLTGKIFDAQYSRIVKELRDNYHVFAGRKIWLPL